MENKHNELVMVGLRIRQIRKSKGFTQETLADTCHLDWRYIGSVERGEQNISIRNLIRIAIALNVEVGELVPPIAELK